MSAEPCKKEDIRSGDVTADLISEAQTGRALLMTREAMILSGLPYATETFAQVDPEVVITWLVNEGDAINAGSQLAIFEGPARALLTARQLLPSVKVQVEVETFEEFDEALAAQLDIILLNNFDTQALQQALSRRSTAHCDHIEFEASSGITEENLREIGCSGVDRISLGTLTKGIRAIDLSMRVELS